MLERKFSNNKAAFEIHTHTVRKNNFNLSQNEKDYENLKSIGDIFKPFMHDNWSYDFVRIIKFSREEGVLMERIPRVTIRDLSDLSSYNYYQAGVWLGYFHSITKNGNKVLAFTDYTMDNIMISTQRKTVTAFDPSSCREEDYYFDIISFIKSTIISHYKRKTKYDVNCVRKFLEGYQVFGSFKFDRKLFDEHVSRKIKSEIKSKKIKKNGRIKIYLGVLILHYHLKIKLKKILKNY